jgi:hypothetical protein
MIGHIGLDSDGDVLVDRPQQVDVDALTTHDLRRDLDEALGVGDFR